jgi:hypothetical protein
MPETISRTKSEALDANKNPAGESLSGGVLFSAAAAR